MIKKKQVKDVKKFMQKSANALGFDIKVKAREITFNDEYSDSCNSAYYGAWNTYGHMLLGVFSQNDFRIFYNPRFSVRIFPNLQIRVRDKFAIFDFPEIRIKFEYKRKNVLDTPIFVSKSIKIADLIKNNITSQDIAEIQQICNNLGIKYLGVRGGKQKKNVYSKTIE